MVGGEPESMQVRGIVFRRPHIALSSRKHVLKVGLAGLRMLRVYAGFGSELSKVTRRRTFSRYSINHAKSSSWRFVTQSLYPCFLKIFDKWLGNLGEDWLRRRSRWRRSNCGIRDILRRGIDFRAHGIPAASERYILPPVSAHSPKTHKGVPTSQLFVFPCTRTIFQKIPPRWLFTF